MAKYTILVIEDDNRLRDHIRKALCNTYRVLSAVDEDMARNRIGQGVDIVLADIRLGDNDNGGLDFLKWSKKNFPEVPVVMMTAYGSIELAVEAIRNGAEDFLQKPINFDNLEIVLNRVLDKKRLLQENLLLKRQIEKEKPKEIIGDSDAINEIKKKIGIAARDGNITVLIQGETGTGKDLVAWSIYKEGKRKEGPFVAKNLKEIETQDLLPSLLFGHEKGAFTDAQEQRVGLFERANGGVLFLDEVALLDENTQSKLLRFIENRTFSRLGGADEIEVDLQIITATNADLLSLVEQKKFREDLYYRLMIFPIFIPPLRDHKEDIPLLANHFIRRLNEQGRTTANKISEEVLEKMMENPWKGNVRELKNFIETAALYADMDKEKSILPQHCISFPEEHQMRPITKPIIPEGGIDLAYKLAEMELAYIEQALKITGQNKKETSRLLGYTHRDYARRVIRRLQHRYPHLFDKFSYINEQFVDKKRVSRKNDRGRDF